MNYPVDHWQNKIAEMKDIETEAHERGMKNINIWHDHVLIELESKTLKIWYNGTIEVMA